MKTVILFVLTSIFLLTACKKESFITSPDANVSITVDTLHYDTVFTSAGSITQSFKIINENDQKLRLSSVRLMGGTASSFSINVDGLSTIDASNVEINGNDSVYVFVQVNIDPSSGALPFVIRDSIQISYNGKNRLVQLEAWGQNAHFMRNKEVLSNETWTNDLPYVILGYLYVDLNQKLTIEKGCRVYVHADAPVIIDGTLQVNGELDTVNRVYFQGDRLDEPYKDYPAAWPGIYFRSTSHDNVMNYAVIKNSYQSIAVEDPSPNSNPKLILNNCIIDNSYDAGIIALNGSIRATNTLISNCGKNIALAKGGNYEFVHCTVASYSNSYIQHQFPVLAVSNSDGTSTAPLNALFRNCIFWGESEQVEDEVIVTAGGSDAVHFDHALWRVKTTPQGVTSNDIINNTPPLFDSINVSRHFYNFRLQSGSPAIDKGNPSTQSTVDMDGHLRTTVPDLGSFEKE